MIKTNAADVAKSLEEYKKEIERKLKHMVVGFAQDVADAASNATRIGHISEGGNTAKYIELYKRRAMPEPVGYGIKPIEGFHKGAWTYSEGSLTFNNTIFDKATMLGKVDYKAEANYKIGDSFSIAAIGPAYGMLQKLDDIDGVALHTIMAAHKSNLERYFKEG